MIPPFVARDFVVCYTVAVGALVDFLVAVESLGPDNIFPAHVATVPIWRMQATHPRNGYWIVVFLE